MSQFNQADFDRFFAKRGGVIGKGTKRRPTANAPVEDGSSQQPESLKKWVKQMDDKNGWGELDKRVEEFSQQFEVSRSKALIYLLFDIF